MASFFPFIFSLVSLLLLQTRFPFAQAAVPASETFKYVNEGEFGDYIVEYGGTYRPLSVFSSPFQLCFYNTTPNAYTLALRIGVQRQEPFYRWVWEANRGKPVGENATLTFETDGNLVLAEAEGRVVWQTGTANKGVVGFNLLPNGNMVLHDSKGKFLWQSFDYATDTLLVGQFLRTGATTKLVSRASEEQNSDGPYSLVMEPKSLAFYYTSKNSPKPMLYYQWLTIDQGSLTNVTFNAEIYTDQGDATELRFDYSAANTQFSTGGRIIARPKYNATLTYLRLGVDGNVRLYTYNILVDYRPTEVTYTLFSRDSDDVDECQLPDRCGNFGLCENNQCVACPSSKGLFGWSKECAAEKVTSCAANGFGYYKLVGVDHFMSKYTSGSALKESDCMKKCSTDCKCLGYFYHQDTSKCWIAYDLKTLSKVANSTHLGYIKVPK
ncbi:hypothetical protein RJ639_005339 [Escallonia herrerae]|uniref:Uncharacterized protein n=1 Tax=Escallonia herrerae TaxID=1293975 RepID=A0AA88VZB3_9ASTE|nr:hypothetical protein RJ639_005339 [Escallonia herrerae]